MPLEIRELIIKASVDNNSGNSSGNANQIGTTGESDLNEIAERVLEIIQQKAER